MSNLFLGLRALLRRTAVDREIDQELRFHVDRQIESYKKAGLDDGSSAPCRRARCHWPELIHDRMLLHVLPTPEKLVAFW